MKPLLSPYLFCVSLFCACLAFAGRAAAADTWPAACGDQKINFDVKNEKSQAAPSAPAEGKAQIIFFQSENRLIAPFHNATIRFGIDGAWVGATQGDAYFVTTVDPGEHHLCASWQSTLKRFKRDLDLTPLNAEPGHTYYFVAQVNVESENTVTFGLSPLNEDEGKYRAANLKVSVSKPK